MQTFAVAVAMLLHSSTNANAAGSCVPQAMPAPIDAVAQPPQGLDFIEFAATPSLEYPGRSWIVRLSHRGANDTKIEILRLRRQMDCNRWDIENRWQAPMRKDEFDAIAVEIAPLGLPPASLFSPTPMPFPSEMVLDGTSTTLRLRNGEWQVKRALNHYSVDGAKVSAIFYDLVSKYIAASERPTKEWRSSPTGADR